ncbi:MAG: hypothetical protein Q4Q00_11125 [Turicibacter sp.]|nr:hypothetical protein [Turicibacter sp.]
MALGILFIFMVVLFILSFICVMLMWIAKRERFKRTMIYICFLLSLFIVWISVTSLPTNYIISKLIGWMIGGLSVIGMVGFYKQKLELAKVMMTLSICLGILQLFFF